ncbi:nitronate monooxygenase [Xenophilus sp.]|uniref:nitronate monooxygenase n=1 Tax=Xenophilus sp. TaxID=1873499 RepID=UPI0037DCFE3C
MQAADAKDIEDPALRRAAGVLHRPVCELLGCRLPLVLAGMGGVARAELVTAVTRAGGFGLLGMVREPPALIREQVQAVRAATDRPFGVSIIPAATEAGLLRRQVDLLLTLEVPAVCLFWDLSAPIVERCRAAGTRVLCQVGSAAEALAAQEAGAQVLIAQGMEAGGHVRGRQPLAELLPEVLAAVRIPVLAAGGLADGGDVAAVLSAGAQGAMLGTALLATHESFAHPYHQQRIVDAREGDTLLTEDFHINWPRGAGVRVLVNSVTRGEHGSPFSGARIPIGADAGRPILMFSTDSPLRSTSGNLEAMALYAGQGAARIDRIAGAAERLRAIALDTADRLGAELVQGSQADPGAEAGRRDDTLIAALDELLEAERAGARVALTLLREGIGDDALAEVMREVHRGEVQWCGVLMTAIRRLDGTPGTRTGDFFGKVMALPDLPARLALLNRGQGWVAKKLKALLPEIGDEELRAALGAMLTAHQDNIEHVNAHLAPVA